jgi:hypothetical protein
MIDSELVGAALHHCGGSGAGRSRIILKEPELEGAASFWGEPEP